MEKIRKTTWNDYHSENTEKKEIEIGSYISEFGRSRYEVQCPFCSACVKVYAWVGQKRCECGAILSTRPNVAFKIKG